MNPEEIEKKSFEIISDAIRDKKINHVNINIVKRVIHTTADFDFADNLIFSDNAVEAAVRALHNHAKIVTDTKMAMAGINKKCLEAMGCSVHCFIDLEEVAALAKEKGVTRSRTAVDYAVSHLDGTLIFAVGNAPTALIRLYELINMEQCQPELIIGVPVGFVNVVEAKELILSLDIPYIVAKGRKGGSTVAAAVCNALLYS